MRLNFTRSRGRSKGLLPESLADAKTWIFIMRVSALCMFFLVLGFHLLQAEPGYGQTIGSTVVNIQARHTSMQAVFSMLEDETDFMFIFPADLVEQYTDVSVAAGTKSVKDVLEQVLKSSRLVYRESGNNIIIFDRVYFEERMKKTDSFVPVKGRVTDKDGVAMPGVNVVVKGTSYGIATDSNGDFQLEVPDNAELLVFSFIGYKTIEVNISGRTQIDAVMETDATTLESVIVVDYYSTTKRTATGSIATVSAKELENQPITSPLLGLQGRMTGVEVTPTSGTPGSAVKILIRGQNSTRTRAVSNDGSDGTQPLYVIDGIPISSDPIASSSTSLVTGGFDPLGSLNPANIESIKVLKDADATAIYGSRGANGVVLITTKNKVGVEGTSFDVGYYRGFGELVNRVEMLNTSEYLQMRHEAIQNDGGTALEFYNDPIFGPLIYPDLLRWDTTRYTDWQDLLLGNKTDIHDMQVRFSGGTGRTSFNIGGSYHKETLLYPGDFSFNRYSADLGVQHSSSDERLIVSFSTNFGVNDHRIFDSNILAGNALTLPPVAPALYNEDGTLNWERNAFGFSTWSNPMSWLRSTHESSAISLYLNTVATYKVAYGFAFKVSAGYSILSANETFRIPITAKDPYGFDKYGGSGFNTSDRTSWIAEPQVTYTRTMQDHQFDAIMGLSLQQAESTVRRLRGDGYTSDVFLGSFASAPVFSDFNSSTQYRYGALFARLSYNFKDKYYVSLTGRRDGSSRFGPGNRYGNFGAVGVGWVFTNKDLIGQSSILSFGKLRASYGITGNDQIGDSKYLKTYSLAAMTYNGNLAIKPTELYNPNYAWEQTQKLEFALETAFLKNRISLEVAWYQNRSSNQLVQYQLPSIAGFSSVLTNFDAIVENTGWEFLVNTTNLERQDFRWTSSLNFSVSDNALASFPGIEDSPYASIYQVGQPLSVQRGYIYEGVDPAIGIYTFRDVDGDGEVTSEDQRFLGSLRTKYFGGFNNTIAFNGFELSFLLQFSDRTVNVAYFTVPGLRSNQPVSVLNRWQKEGDITNVQRYTTMGEAADAYSRYQSSNGVLEDISFLRLKTLSLAYAVPYRIIERAKVKYCKIFIQGQNLLTWTNFDGWDPETVYGTPPLRILSGGIQVKF